MECPVCINPWDLQGTRPKALPCQHSLCQSCLVRLNDRQCPTCRKAFVRPVPDNFALVACLEVMEQDRPAASWWCVDCESASSARCMEEHAVARPKVALRRVLQGVAPRAAQCIQGLQERVPDLQDGAALAALQLLGGGPATCSLAVRREDGQAFAAEWRVHEQEHAEDALFKTLVAALAASGRLQQGPREPRREARPAALRPEAAGAEGAQQEAGVEGGQQEAAPAAPQPADQRIDVLDLHTLSRAGPGAMPQEKEETLRLVQRLGVRWMNNVFCSSDPAWFLELLVSASPSLDELRVWNPGEGHLLAVHGMPRLRRLDLQCTEGDLDEAPPVLPALPHRSSLQWLRVGGLPLATTRSLLLAHGPALEVLWLDMGAVPGGEWPEGCSDLAALLAPCAALARLVFRRYDHDRGACRDQLTVARAALPACTVQCQQCDRVAYEDF